MYWESIFPEHILNRGYDYYEQNLIHHLEVSTKQLKAKVDGSQSYTVEINYQDQDKLITNLSCDCPHYVSGYFCKHLAAFLFYLENEFKDFSDMELSIYNIYNKQTQGEITEESVDELVSKAENDMIRAFLIDILKENPTLKNRFKGRLGYEISSQDLQEYKMVIDDIFLSHGKGSDNFIDYYSSMDLETELTEFIDEKIEELLIKNNYYEGAFELIKTIFLKISTQALDDSNGIVMTIAYECQYLWGQIIHKSSIEMKREMYDWFKKQLMDEHLDSMADVIEEVVFKHFIENEFLFDQKEFSKNKFLDYKNQENTWWSTTMAEEWAIRYLNVLEALEDLNTLDKFCGKNPQYPKVREFYADKNIERNNYKKAIQILEEGSIGENDSRNLEISYEYQMKRKDLYKKMGWEKKYQKELWNLIIHKKSINRELYEEYKLLYSEKEWEENKRTVIKSLSSAKNIDVLYEEEGFYDLLIQKVVNTYGLSKLQKYEKKLVKLYPKEVYDRYEKEIMTLAKHARPRKKYKKIVSLLRRMQRLPSKISKEKVSEISYKLRKTYNNRPAMMDELSRL